MSTPDQSSKLSSSMKSVKSIESLKSMESVDDNSPYQSNYDHDLDAYIILPNGDKIQRQKIRTTRRQTFSAGDKPGEMRRTRSEKSAAEEVGIIRGPGGLLRGVPRAIRKNQSFDRLPRGRSGSDPQGSDMDSSPARSTSPKRPTRTRSKSLDEDNIKLTTPSSNT